MEQCNIPDMPMTFTDRKARTEAKQRLAQSLGVSIRRVNRMKLCEKPLESVQKREKKAEKAAKHRENCQKLAKMVTNRQISLKNAAKQANISERQMGRYIAKYLQELLKD